MFCLWRTVRVADAQVHEYVYEQLKERGVDCTVSQQYTSDIFVGASVQIASSNASSRMLMVYPS